MELGEVVEYIENRRIVCAVVLKIYKKKLKVLAESGREIKLSFDRVFHKSSIPLNLLAGKAHLLESVKKISYKRRKISETIDVAKLWHQAKQKPTWIEPKLLAELYFKNSISEHEHAAIVRAFFNDKLYFKFRPISFFPNSEKKINKIKIEIKQASQHQKLIKTGADWIKNIITNHYSSCTDNNLFEIKNILRSFYVFGKTSQHYNVGRKILAQTSIDSKEELFNFMVKIGLWNINENIDILRFKIPKYFSCKTETQAKKIEKKSNYFSQSLLHKRVDLTNKFTITIDGANTLDFDDAISIEQKNNNYLIGVHISDVAHYVKRNDIIDKAAFKRISSIYMPDMKIPMIPPNLSENIFSLKKGKIRAAISTIIEVDNNTNIISYNIYQSIIKVDEQLTYCEVDKSIQHNDKKMITLLNVAKNLRKIRIEKGATQITLPEININLKKTTPYNIEVEKINRESPSRVIIEEIMILVNWITAQFLEEQKIPSIFRSQLEPKENMIKNHTGSIYHNWMQRKKLKKLYLSNRAKRHCVLGLDAYVTASSPIRKYSDLVTQRQIHAAIKIDQSYSSKEIRTIIQRLDNYAPNISKIQFSRKRYWLFKYLENKIGEKKEAIVLQKNKSSYIILIKKYMLECILPQSSGIDLKAKDIIWVTIQYVSARNNTISVSMM